MTNKTTAASIKAEIERLEKAESNAIARANAAKVKLTDGVLTLTSKARRELADQADDAALEARQFAAKSAELAGPLADALENEAIEAAIKNHTVLADRLAKHSARFAAEYPALDSALRALILERQQLFGDIESHNQAGLSKVDGTPLAAALREVKLLKTDAERAEEQRWSEWNRLTTEQQNLLQQAETSRANGAARGPLIMNDVPPAVVITVDGKRADYTSAA